jgi:hypothetical protein
MPDPNVNVAAELLAELRHGFRGELIQPADIAYSEAHRVWNAAAQRKPALIARCADVDDVKIAVRTAAAAGALTAVRCGGHSLAGYSTCEGGFVIDLARLRGVKVDAQARRARAEGGCLLGSIDTATQSAGLVFPAGVVSHTGASGLILGGGTGWLTRWRGLSVDNVVGHTLVTADGSVVRASASENEELFWALRGGGGNFGVVVEFELALHKLSSLVLGGALCFGDDIANVLRHWRDSMPAAPDELKWNISLRLAPKAANVPAKLQGKPTLSESIVWYGAEEEGYRRLKQIFSLAKCAAVTQETVSYLKLQTMADEEFPHGRRYYTKSGYFKTLGDDCISVLLSELDSIPSANTQIELAYLGGAAGRIAASETAFGDRSASFIMNLLADWQDAADDGANVAWVRNLFVRLKPYMTPGVYTNFMSGDEDDRTQEAYRERWDKLVAVKTYYDPENFFRLNQNIAPRKTS